MPLSVPRLGGVPVLAGMLLGALWLQSGAHANWFLIPVLAAAPAFFGGLCEDLTKRFPPEREAGDGVLRGSGRVLPP